MERNAADQLDIEVTHAKGSSPGFTDGRECFREHAVERLTFCETLSERRRKAREGVVWQAAHLLIVRIGGNYQASVLAQKALVAATEDRLQKLEHGSKSLLAAGTDGCRVKVGYCTKLAWPLPAQGRSMGLGACNLKVGRPTGR